MDQCERCLKPGTDRPFRLSLGESLGLCLSCADEWELTPEEVQYKKDAEIREKAIWKFCKENNPWKESFEDFMHRLHCMKRD